MHVFITIICVQLLNGGLEALLKLSLRARLVVPMARAVVAIEIAARTPKLSARGWNMAATSILVAPELLARKPAADVKPWSKRAGSVSCLFW